MRVDAIRATTSVLLRYFKRRVLSVGILQKTSVRVGIAATILVMGLLTTALNYLFLRDAGVSNALLLFLSKGSSLTVIQGSMAAFLFIRILFWRSDEMLTFVEQLPLSHRERIVSLLLFEGMFVVGIAISMYVPMAISLSLLLGIGALPTTLVGLVFPAAITFLLLAIFTNFLSQVFSHRRLRALGSILIPASLIALIAFFSALVPPLIGELSREALAGGNSFHGIDAFSYVAIRYTHWVSIGIFIVSAAVLTALALALVPRTYPKTSRNLNIPIITRKTALWPYLAALSRRGDSLLLVVLTFVISLTLFVKGNEKFGYALIIPLAQGIYSYSATRNLRLMPGYSATAAVELRRIIFAQITISLVYTIPFLGLYAFKPATAINIFGVLAAQIGTVSVATFLGVLFPPDRENPFSIMASLVLCLLFGLILVVTLAILRLPVIANVLIIIALQVLALYYSVQAIESLRKKERYA